jgi:hypothetical protein
MLIAGALACLDGTVPGILFPLLPDEAKARLMLFPLFFCDAFASGAAPSAFGAVTSNQTRGQVSALYLLAINLLDIGLARPCRHCPPIS